MQPSTENPSKLYLITLYTVYVIPEFQTQQCQRTLTLQKIPKQSHKLHQGATVLLGSIWGQLFRTGMKAARLSFSAERERFNK